MYLNRTAVVVKAREPFLEWTRRTAEPGEVSVTLDQLRHDPGVYLLPGVDYEDDAWELVRDYAEEIFEHELRGWLTDPGTWPADRGPDEFRRWFDVEVHTGILDLADGPLMDDEDEDADADGA